eukprot:g12039.t1
MMGSWPMVSATRWRGCMHAKVPGHEIAGIVQWAGKDTEFKKGDRVGVGVMHQVDSCMECASCESGTEQYCSNGATFTYASPAKHGRACPDGEETKGGYSQLMVVHSRFVAPVLDDLALDKFRPILCPGITVYNPLVHWKAGSDGAKRVGVVRGGGLGMIAIKIAKAMGCEVTAVTRTMAKVDELKHAGADRVIVSCDEEPMKAGEGSLDLMLDTASAEHSITDEVRLLAANGHLVMLGIVTEPADLSLLPMLSGRISVAGSCIGGMPATEQVLQFCAKHGILPDTVLVGPDKVNDVYKTLRDDAALRD